MQDINWIQVAIGFLSGGAFGALIKQYFENRRNKIQVIRYKIDIREIYNSGRSTIMDSQITLNENGIEYRFPNLYSGSVILLNSSLHDYPEFEFGITAQEDNKFIQFNSFSADRHHIATVLTPPSVINNSNIIDIKLKPFNRKDQYQFTFLMTTSKNSIYDSDLIVSTSKAIKLIRIGDNDLIEVASKSIVETILQASISNIVKSRF